MKFDECIKCRDKDKLFIDHACDDCSYGSAFRPSGRYTTLYNLKCEACKSSAYRYTKEMAKGFIDRHLVHRTKHEDIQVIAQES